MTLPQLRMNHAFVDAFLAASAPCFAMGVVEEGHTSYACLALRPVDDIPPDATRGGFSFGHSVLGTANYEVVHFAFEFYGYRIFNGLVNPNNAIARTVLPMMLDRQAFFFLALNSFGSVIAFKSDVGDCSLDGIVSNLSRIDQSATTHEQYEAALAAFSDRPRPVGPMLHWVCRDNEDYLDLSGDVIELDPA